MSAPQAQGAECEFQDPPKNPCMLTKASLELQLTVRQRQKGHRSFFASCPAGSQAQVPLENLTSDDEEQNDKEG